MAWTTPPTFVSGNVLTAAQLNLLTGDLLVSIPAKAVQGITLDPSYIGGNSYSPGYYTATGANALSEMRLGQQTITTIESTTSSAFADLATVGPQVSVTANSLAIVFINVGIQADTTATVATGWMVTGATTIAATNNGPSLSNAAVANRDVTLSSCRSTALTSGVNTFTMQYVVSAGTTGTFQRRHMTVWPF